MPLGETANVTPSAQRGFPRPRSCPAGGRPPAPPGPGAGPPRGRSRSARSSRIGPRAAGRGGPAAHWPAAGGAGPPPASAAAAGPGAGRARGRRAGAEGRAGPSRASVPAPGAAEQSLISVGSWRPVRARAPRPNSMAIVRRPLCSGGGHFLRGRPGTGGQETLRAEAQTPRPPQPGVRGDGHLPRGRPGLGAGGPAGLSPAPSSGSQGSRRRVGARGAGWRVPSWGGGGGGWAHEIRSWRAGRGGGRQRKPEGYPQAQGCPSQVGSLP